jgi:hypothetical protein
VPSERFICRLTPKISAARHGCHTAKALYLSDFTHHPSPKLPPRVRCSLLLGVIGEHYWNKVSSAPRANPRAISLIFGCTRARRHLQRCRHLLQGTPETRTRCL